MGDGRWEHPRDSAIVWWVSRVCGAGGRKSEMGEAQSERGPIVGDDVRRRGVGLSHKLDLQETTSDPTSAWWGAVANRALG
jgi:hypothetical protein